MTQLDRSFKYDITLLKGGVSQVVTKFHMGKREVKALTHRILTSLHLLKNAKFRKSMPQKKWLLDAGIPDFSSKCSQFKTYSFNVVRFLQTGQLFTASY